MGRTQLSILTLAISFAAAGEELYEDFHAAPNLSEGWTYGETVNVDLDRYDNASSLDDRTPLGADLISLKVAKGKTADVVVAEVLSPVSALPLRQCSFFCKSNGSGENGDVVSVSGRVDGTSEWKTLTSLSVEGYAKHWVTNGIAESANVHQLKFAVSAPVASYKAISLDSLYASSDPVIHPGTDDPTKPTNLKLEATAPDAVEATWDGAPGEGGYRVELFNVLSIDHGEIMKESVDQTETIERVAVFSNLNATASYFVTVRPEPSDDPALVATSDVVDLSKEHFRKTGALPVTLRNLTCEERFDSLSNFVSRTKNAKIFLDFWQFVKDGAAMDPLVLSRTNSAPQVAGCYVCRDKDKIADIDSAMIGTLASGEIECAVGLAMRNDTTRTLKGMKVTFDSVQRCSNANPATYAFEWRIADGEASIASGADWKQVGIPETAPVTSEKRSVMPEYRQRDIVAVIPAKLPAGKVLLMRWRHPKMTSGPMMAIDNVRIAFDKPSGNYLSVR